MPIIVAKRGLFLSVIMPMGMPDAYMPRFAAVPWNNQICNSSMDFAHTIMFACVAESCSFSANWGAHAEYAYYRRLEIAEVM